jgi:hypothetical protein
MMVEDDNLDYKWVQNWYYSEAESGDPYYEPLRSEVRALLQKDWHARRHKSLWDPVKKQWKEDSGTTAADYRAMRERIDGWKKNGIATAARQGDLLTEKLGSPPTELQRSIWEALDGQALMKTALANKCSSGDQVRLYYTNRKKKTGGLRELQEIGLVDNKPGVGYYRPDAPPSN